MKQPYLTEHTLMQITPEWIHIARQRSHYWVTYKNTPRNRRRLAQFEAYWATIMDYGTEYVINMNIKATASDPNRKHRKYKKRVIDRERRRLSNPDELYKEAFNLAAKKVHPNDIKMSLGDSDLVYAAIQHGIIHQSIEAAELLLRKVSYTVAVQLLGVISSILEIALKSGPKKDGTGWVFKTLPGKQEVHAEKVGQSTEGEK